MNKLLTIYVQTYNRSKVVVQLIDEIVASDLINLVKVVVVDDGSSDDTYEKLKSRNYGKNIIINGRKENIGIVKGLLEFIPICQTDFFLYMVDDDMLREEGIMELIPFLARIKPDFVSTAWGMWDEDIMWKNTMRTKNSNEKIKFKDIRAASDHAPGVVFNTFEVSKHVPEVKKRIEEGCYATTIFPIVVLALLLAFSNNKCWWFKEVVGGYRPLGALPSNLRYNGDMSWVSMEGRWNEQKSFGDIYQHIYKTTKDNWKKQASQLLIMHNLEFYYRIESGIKKEKPELIENLSMVLAIKFLRNPISFIKYIIKYLVARYKFMYYMK